MSEQEMREFLFSLAWSPWSSYNSTVVTQLLSKAYPNVSFDDELKHFSQIITSSPCPGSPK